MRAQHVMCELGSRKDFKYKRLVIKWRKIEKCAHYSSNFESWPSKIDLIIKKLNKHTIRFTNIKREMKKKTTLIYSYIYYNLSVLYGNNHVTY